MKVFMPDVLERHICPFPAKWVWTVSTLMSALSEGQSIPIKVPQSFCWLQLGLAAYWPVPESDDLKSRRQAPHCLIAAEAGTPLQALRN